MLAPKFKAPLEAGKAWFEARASRRDGTVSSEIGRFKVLLRAVKWKRKRAFEASLKRIAKVMV